MSAASPHLGLARLRGASLGACTAEARAPWPVRASLDAVAAAVSVYILVGPAPMIDPGAAISADGGDIERIALMALAAPAGLSLAMRRRAAFWLAVRAWRVWPGLGRSCASVARADFPVAGLFARATGSCDPAAIATPLVLVVIVQNPTESSLWMRGPIGVNLTIPISLIAFREPVPARGHDDPGAARP